MLRDRLGSVLATVAVAAILLPSTLTAQTTFQRTYGGTGDDCAYSVQQTSDGGYIVAGETWSFGAGSGDVYLVKVDAAGNTQWTRTIGGTGYDGAYSVQQTSDGGYIVAGETWSFGAGRADVYLVKTDASGETAWTRTFGSAIEEYGMSVQQTADGGYVIAGFNDSTGSWISDVYFIKTDADGHPIWTKTFGGVGGDFGFAVLQTSDSGYIIAGATTSLGAGRRDVYLIRTNRSGDTIWTRAYGGWESDEAVSVQQTADGGFIVAGYTESLGAGSGDIYVIRIDKNGDFLWSSSYGGTGVETGSSALPVVDGYMVTGTTESFGAAGSQFYILKVDADGDTLWTRNYGGSDNERSYSAVRATDGGLVIVGYTSSFGAGGQDVYLIKTDSLGDVGVAEPKVGPMRTRNLTLACEPNPCRGQTVVSLKPQASGLKPVALRVYGASGCLVHSDFGHRTSSFRLDLRSLPAGAYFVRCDVAGQHATKRVVLQR